MGSRPPPAPPPAPQDPAGGGSPPTRPDPHGGFIPTVRNAWRGKIQPAVDMARSSQQRRRWTDDIQWSAAAAEMYPVAREGSTATAEIYPVGRKISTLEVEIYPARCKHPTPAAKIYPLPRDFPTPKAHQRQQNSVAATAHWEQQRRIHGDNHRERRQRICGQRRWSGDDDSKTRKYILIDYGKTSGSMCSDDSSTTESLPFTPSSQRTVWCGCSSQCSSDGSGSG